ncbi:MAG: glycosyltransferase family 2 protein [Candidatus Kariarchaeaceae archaeon]|jgi:dolichol-phosphate mannosyltransferase
MIHDLNNLVTVIIPVLNEEKAISRVIRKIKEEGYYNILVVDGFSSDDTFYQAIKNGVNVIYQKGKGKTGAIKTAIKKAETKYLVILDGDCTYDPKDIENVVSPLSNSDLVIGVRALGRNNIPLFNRIGNRMINQIFNLLMGTKLQDVCSGMYSLKTEFAKNLTFKTEGFDVEVEIAAQASKYGKISQVPIRYHDRVGQQKLQPVKDGLHIIFRVLLMAVKLRLNGKPLKMGIQQPYDNDSTRTLSHTSLG